MSRESRGHRGAAHLMPALLSQSPATKLPSSSDVRPVCFLAALAAANETHSLRSRCALRFCHLPPLSEIRSQCLPRPQAPVGTSCFQTMGQTQNPFQVGTSLSSLSFLRVCSALRQTLSSLLSPLESEMNWAQCPSKRKP